MAGIGVIIIGRVMTIAVGDDRVCAGIGEQDLPLFSGISNRADLIPGEVANGGHIAQRIGPCFGSKTRAKVKKMKLLTMTTLTMDREIQGGNMPASLLYTICFCFQGDSVLMLF